MRSPSLALRTGAAATPKVALAFLLAVGLVGTFGASHPALAGVRVLHVDRRDVHCSDLGNGTATTPYCTIGAAMADVGPGMRVDVASGTYPEAVKVRASGTAKEPIVIQVPDGEHVTIAAQGTGITLAQVSWVTISGFNVNDPTGYGIVVAQSSHVTVESNHIRGAGKPVNGGTRYGVLVKGTTKSSIVGNISEHNSDAGFAIVGRSTGIRLTDNRSYGNARQYRRAAPGIDMEASGNVIARNVVYNNEDSGIQLYNGAADNVIVDNLSYGNGDHGIDALYSPGSTITSNTIVGNATSGITLESYSGGATISDNIVAQNGVGQRGDIWIDTTSAQGTSLNFDLVWQTAPGAASFTLAGGRYTTIWSLRKATGQEGRGKVGNPLFVDASGGDFRLSGGSPAIDSADSSSPGAPLSDLVNTPRIDDPATPNTGVGTCRFADRGALEYQP